MHLLVKKNPERTFRPRVWYSRNSSVWLMYHTPAADGRWCRWGRDTVSPCIRAYILIGPLSDHLRVDVMTHCGGTRAALFFNYFFGNHLRSDADEKVDLGSNERPNAALAL